MTKKQRRLDEYLRQGGLAAGILVLSLLSANIGYSETSNTADECFACFWEICDPEGGQHWDDGDQGSRSGTKHTDCKAGDCHGSGGGSLATATVLQMLTAYDTDDLGTIQRLLASHPTSIHLNAGRQAIQIDGCDGALQATLPLSNVSFARLVERLLYAD